MIAPHGMREYISTVDDKALCRNLIELLKGGQAHTTPEEALRGIDPKLRTLRPSKDLPSIYEELEHMRIAQEDILRYTLDPGWQSPPWPEGYWPEDNDTLTGRKWKGAVKGFFDDLAELVDLVNDPARDLTAPIPHGEGRTCLREVLLVADHNAYHMGQIVQTRKLLGDWGK